MTDKYLIWSNEHRAWWGPSRSGYTVSVAEAGRYTKETAEEIVEDANLHANRHVPEGHPNEVMVLAPIAWAMA